VDDFQTGFVEELAKIAAVQVFDPRLEAALGGDDVLEFTDPYAQAPNDAKIRQVARKASQMAKGIFAPTPPHRYASFNPPQVVSGFRY